MVAPLADRTGPPGGLSLDPIESLILTAGVLLLAAVVVSRLSDKVGVPTLLLFLVLGMLAGSEGIGGIAFDSMGAAQSVGTVALLIILFSGGLDTDVAEIRPVLAPGLLLATVGVLLTAMLLGTFAWWMLGEYSSFDIGPKGLTWLQGLLLAAIVSSTDAAAVFSVFRTSDVQPRRRVRALLELESGSNDPMAVLLTTAILGLMTSGSGGAAGVALDLVVQLVVGALGGGAVGLAGAWGISRLKLSAQGLYPILALAIALLSFGIAEALGGNGFLAAYAGGLALGNRVDPALREPLRSFHDGLSWLVQIGMFVVLGLLVFPSRLPAVAGVSVALALFLMFVARPLAVVTCLAIFRPAKGELAYVSWVGLRGSVPIVLATFPASYGIEGADAIFNVVFFIVVTSVLVQGLTLVPCARWSGVVEREESE